MRIENEVDLATQMVQMLHNAECQLILALPRVAGRVADPRLAGAIQEHHAETKMHARRLEELAAALGIDCSGRRCMAMEGLLKDGEEIMGFGCSEVLVDTAIIGACQGVEHYEISQYRALIGLLGQVDGNAAQGVRQTLQEEEQASGKLSAICAGMQHNSPQGVAS